jgi:hypothetical protein
MWAVRELTAVEVVGHAPFTVAREYCRMIRKKWPKLNAKLVNCPNIASNKIYMVTEHRSLAEVEQWNEAFWADEDVQVLAKRQRELDKENGGRNVYSPYRDLYLYDISEE